MPHNPGYDIVIVGGGMVGASLGLALSGQAYSVLLLEAGEPATHADHNRDPRSTALALASARCFQALNVWQALSSYTQAITDIHVSEAGGRALCHMDRRSACVPALGYVIENKWLSTTLWDQVSCCDDITVRTSTTVTGMARRRDHVELTLSKNGQDEHINCRLLIAADGANSQLRGLCRIPAAHYDYHQHAILTTLKPRNFKTGWAFERFTADGPMALLPLPDRRYALVWCMSASQAESLSQCDETVFNQAMQKVFGYRLGRLQVAGARYRFPLSFTKAAQTVSHRCLLMGNAAHALHPVAGQGFNLCLREVAVLAELLSQHDGNDPGQSLLLKTYRQQTIADERRTVWATHGLVRGFSYGLPGVTGLRNTLVSALDFMPPFKSWFTRQAMGGERLPRLCRGADLITAAPATESDKP